MQTFALGGKESDVQKSIRLLEKTISALRESAPDDVHLSHRISELLASLTSALRTKFVRLAVPSRGNRRNTHQARQSTSHPTANAPNTSTPTSTFVRPATADHRRNSSLTSPNSGRDFYALLGLVNPPPLVDPMDPNITIMPPPDYITHHNTNYSDNMYSTSGGSPRSGSGNVYSPGGGINGNSPANTNLASPSLGNTGNSRPQRPRHNSNTQGPFSPISNASGGGYDWLTLDFNPLLNSTNNPHNSNHSNNNTFPNSNQPNLSPTAHHHTNHHNVNTNPSGGGGLGTRGTSPNVSAGGEERYLGVSPWTGGAFGPEISEGVEWLGLLGSGGNLGWDDTGTGSGGAGW
jgi:hypothetical protein